MLTTKNWRVLWASLAPALFAVALLMGCTPPGPRALLEGERLIHAGNYTKAIERLQVATQMLPSNAQAWNHLGLAYHKAGRPDLALKAYEQALRCDPNLTSVRYNLGCLHLEQNDAPSAIAELTAYALLRDDSVDGWLKLGAAQLRARQWEPAERSYQRALRLQPDLVEALNGLGVAQTQRKHTRDALSSFALALQKQPGYPPALLNSAIVYQQHANNRALALQKYQEYLRTKPAPADAEVIQGIVRQLQLELSPPVHRVAPEVAATPRQTSAPPTTVTTGSVLTTSLPPIASQPTNLLATGPTSTPAAKSFQNSGGGNAASPAQPAAKPAESPHRPVSTPAYSTLPSRTLSAPPSVAKAPVVPSDSRPTTNVTSQIPRAVERVEPSIAATPPPAEPSPSKASAPPQLVQLPDEAPPQPAQDRPAATRPSTQIVASTPVAPKPEPLRVETVVQPEPAPAKGRIIDRLNPGTWFRNRRREPAAPPQLEPIPAIGSSAGVQQMALATRANTGDAGRETPSIRRYAYLSPTKPQPGNRSQADGYFAQAVREHRDGRLAEAITGYRQAIAYDPSFFEAQYNLGLAGYESKDAALSLSAYEAALSINPTSANARYNFALALEQARYYQDAVDELEKLVAQHPEETRAHFSLASLCAEQLMRPDLARVHYRKVLELEPQHPQAAAIRYWLAANP